MVMSSDATGLRQYAVMWTVAGRDRHGEITVAAPVEIRCRWLEGQVDSQDSQGNDIVWDAEAYVDRLVPPDSLLWLGRLAALPADFGLITGTIMQVKQYHAVPSVKATRVRHVVGLMRYKDSPPVVSV
jgi:hypothetical protein